MTPERGASTQLSPTEYQLLVDRSPMLIWRARPDGLCDYFNARWLDFTGRTMEQEFGDGWAQGVHPDDLQRCLDHYRAHLARRAPFEMEYRLRRADGAWRWIADHGAPFFDERGAFAGYIGNCLDITDSVEAQRAREQRHRAELEGLRALLAICAWCKKVRAHDGTWQEVGTWFERQGLGLVSHGMCDHCADEQERR